MKNTNYRLLQTTIEPVVTRPSQDRWFLIVLLILFATWVLGSMAHASTTHLPGEDVSDKLEAAGTLMRLVDSVLFSWGARIFAGIAVLSAGWNFKEQRIGIALMCVVAAVVLGTAPTWVKNIFDIGGGGSIFSIQEQPHSTTMAQNA